MAEDLSIKVKVEPDGGGVQGKLDELKNTAKKYQSDYIRGDGKGNGQYHEGH